LTRKAVGVHRQAKIWGFNFFVRENLLEELTAGKQKCVYIQSICPLLSP